jgi:hypothetical protein
MSRLLIVGNPEEHHVGAHFLEAAQQLGWKTQLLDIRESRSTNVWINRLFHRLLGKRPAYLGRFNRTVVAACREQRPQLLLVTGITPPSAGVLRAIGRMGIHRANFLTDDPWNPANGARFFWPALREYDVIWSPRRANMGDLRNHGCRRVEYLPFAYNPALHFAETPATDAERERFACDVAFVGGADADRLPVARALVRAGLAVKLYGGYWDRDPELRPHWHGFVHGHEFRLAVCGAALNICLGRKANRDGHAMRSLELPAMGAGMLVEDTLEHRDLFGEDGDCVVYYSDMDDMVAKARALCTRPDRVRELGGKVFQRICRQGHHTYADRLRTILTFLENHS